MAQLAGTSRFDVVKREDGPGRDWILLLATLLLFLVGIAAIGSVSIQHGPKTLVVRQLLFGGLGIVVFAIFNFIKLEAWRRFAPFLYGINIVLLLLVLKFGKGEHGVHRWIDLGPLDFQPSELAKVFVALTLGAYYANRADRIKEPFTLIGAALHVLPFVGLIFLEPQTGAAMGILCVGLAAAIYAEVPVKQFLVAIAASVGLALAVWFTPHVLPDYARGRVQTYIEATFKGKKDIGDDYYQQHKAEVAIGSGGPTGTGFLKGEIVESGVVPVQSTDFIFSVIGEEWGFFGSVLVLGLFAFFFYRVWRVTFVAQTLMARVVAGSLFTILAFHFVVNLCMVLQYGPVVGQWLPFLSYGGTAIWMCLASVGLLEQCSRS